MPDYVDKLIEVFTRCKEQRELVGVSQWRDDVEAFIVGFVVEVNRDRFVLDLVDSDGEADGIHEGSTDDIVRFHVDTDYLRAVRVLYDNRGAVYHSVPAPPSFDHGVLYLDLLQWACENHEIVTVKDHNGAKLYGYPTLVGEDYVELGIVEEEGIRNGFFYVQLEDAKSVTCGSKRDQQLAFLHKKRYEI
jgi:hypothetical protein